MKKFCKNNALIMTFIIIFFTIIISCRNKSPYHDVSPAPMAYVASSPIFTPDEGTYNSTYVKVTISTEVGATIKYTIDGSNPKTSNTVITAKSHSNTVIIILKKSTVIKAFSYIRNHFDSDIINSTVTKYYVISADN